MCLLGGLNRHLNLFKEHIFNWIIWRNIKIYVHFWIVFFHVQMSKDLCKILLGGNFQFSNPFWNYICIITGNHKSTLFGKRLGYIINFRLLLWGKRDDPLWKKQGNCFPSSVIQRLHEVHAQYSRVSEFIVQKEFIFH